MEKTACHTKRCRNLTTRTYCSTCRSRMARDRDPVRYAFVTLRNNAKRRRIPFTITLEQFRQFCKKVDYIGRKGRAADSYTIDRRHNDVGYHIDNIAVVTKTENVKKYFSYDWRTKQAFYTVAAVSEDNPF